MKSIYMTGDLNTGIAAVKDGFLLRADESDIAADIRRQAGLDPDEVVQVNMPITERPLNDPPPEPCPEPYGIQRRV